MIAALSKTLAQLPSAELRRVLGWVLLLTAAAFMALWVALGWAIDSITWSDTGWIDSAARWLSEILGGIAGAVLTLVLFPPVATLVACLFQDRIAAAVERRYYPDLPPAPPMPLAPAVWAAVRLLLWIVAVNLLALPLYLLPGPNLVIYFAINGALLGREYYEVVALRRLTPREAKSLRKRNRFGLWLSGVVIALGFWVPVFNLVMPIAGTAFMVHRFEAARRKHAGA